jgi:hypothetical protein
MTAMQTSLEQMLGSQADQIGARIGADPAQTQAAISAALPALLAGLQGQATPGTGLQQAIEQDHDGSILDDIPGYLQGTANLSPRTTNGEGIVNHVFGGQQQEVARALSSKSGLDMGTIMQLLPILAPIVMGMLGKQARSGGSDPSSGGLGDLGSILGGLGGLGGGGSTTGSPQGGLGEILGGILGGHQSR